MKKILVPTDFSENSKSAFLYALAMAEDLNAEVTVVHIYHPSAHHVNEFYINTDIDLARISAERLDEFISNNTSKTMEGVVVADMVEQKIVIGFAAEKLVECSSSGDYDMIVMGATGSTGLLETVFGKVSLHVAQNAECPVLLIPAGVRYEPIKKMMYASDYESAEGETLLKIEEFAKSFDAEVHLVHVYDETEKQPLGLGHFLLEKTFKLKAPSLAFKMHAITSDTVAHGLQEFAQKEKIDWMILVRPHRKFWQRLIHRSATKELMMNPQLPMMVMH